MIPRIQKSGGSFRGAGQYYLHDKQPEAERADKSLGKDDKPQTDERVWFTDTRNCLNTDPQRALDEMWRTAEDQAWLKQQAGVKRGGRVCEDPVKTLSLAWHKDDQPAPEHMIAAADSFLKHMGWDAHQAVYVGHNDTEHRHIHIIVNRVNPENGRTLDDYREQKRAQGWALAYENEHGKIWCQEREIRAAQRDGRDVEREPASRTEPTREQQPELAPAQRVPANDHLPHNVVMIGRPHEKEFNAREAAREHDDRPDREQLKVDQRAEREAFFKDGGKLFKATRHAVYDQVRKDYAPEWKQFYKDTAEATQKAEASSETALGRALHFAKQGQWPEAREAFGDRDSVRDAVAAEIAERKADLKSRQTEDLRERQRDACDALRDIRDVQYRELLQRQRDERSAANAGDTLDGTAKTNDLAPANENRASEASAPQVADAVLQPQAPKASPEPIARSENFAPEVAASVVGPAAQLPETTHQITDLAAATIGSVASYLADQLGEFFAPTPPEQREAQAKADAKREADKPAPEPEHNPYAQQIEAAMRVIEAERAQDKSREYWEERDKGKGWERDR